MQELADLKMAVNLAKLNMLGGLQTRWPVGTRVNVVLNCRQITPTTGVVVGHDGGGFVRVRIDSAKERSRRGCRDVYFTEMR